MYNRSGIYPSDCGAFGCGKQGDGMGATHLPATEFDGTDIEDRLEAEAEARLGDPAEPMVQLLAPDGTLGSDPVFSDYAERLDAGTLRGFYADMAKIRRFDVEATALQRQGQLALLGSAHRPGGRPDRLRPGQPAAGLHFPHLPRARRRPDPQRRPRRAAPPVPRRLQRRLEPQGHQLPPLYPGPRSADPACGRLRDGHPARPEVRGVCRSRGRNGRPGRGAQGGRYGLLRRRRQLRRRRP